MLLDDSIELDYYNYSASAEPLPMNWDIDLSKIWIPSSLLPNRRKQITANENKSFVSHTLVKPDYSNTFSVYTDECLQHHESQTSAVPHKISPHNLKNNDIDKFRVLQALPSSPNTMKWDEKANIENKEEIFQKSSVNNTKLKDFLRNSRHDDSVIRNAVHCGKKTSNTYSEQNIRSKASLEDLEKRMAEILSEDEPFKENWHHGDVTNAAATGSILDSVPPSSKDSLEELYFSDEDENQFDIEEYKLENAEIKSPMNEHVDNIYINNSCAQRLPSECFVNNLKGLELTKNNTDKIVHQPFKEIEKIPSEEQKIAFDNVFNPVEKYELKEIDSVAHTNDFVQELPNSEEESQDTTEPVVEHLPFAYKRPPLQEPVNKIKPQKDKKKAKKGKINIPLEDLFQKEEVDRFKIPEVDEFYENLVRQGKCKPRNQVADMDEYPFVDLSGKLQTNSFEFSTKNSPNKSHLFWDSAQVNLSSEPQFNSPDKFIRKKDQVDNLDEYLFVNLSEKLQTNSSEISNKNSPNKSQHLFWDSAQVNLSSEPQFNSPDKFIRKKEKYEPDVSLDTLIIDNIPINVSEENIESFVLGFGEMKNLTIERCGKFKRAKLQMDAVCDIDWIIDCLNDSQPFGSSDAELIKCYRQT